MFSLRNWALTGEPSPKRTKSEIIRTTRRFFETSLGVSAICKFSCVVRGLNYGRDTRKGRYVSTGERRASRFQVPGRSEKREAQDSKRETEFNQSSRSSRAAFPPMIFLLASLSRSVRPMIICGEPESFASQCG